MPTSPFRKRQRFSHITRIPLTQGIVPAFHVRSFSRVFADAAVRFDWKHRQIRFPEIAETDAGAIGLGNPLPEPSTRAQAVVTNDKGDDLAGPTTQDRPQPAFPRPLADKRPDLIDFQLVVRLRRFQGRPKRRQRLEFFLSRQPGLSGTPQRSG